MIEIIFDRNMTDIFLDKKRPVFRLENLSAETWEEYRRSARQILTDYQNERIVILSPQDTKLSINQLAVALFVESCFMKTELEAVVFKVEDYWKALENYKPFVALTVGLKYVIRLYQEDLKNAYREIAGLSYLGLVIKEDYIKKSLQITLCGEDKLRVLEAHTLAEMLQTVGILKSLALAACSANISAEIAMPDVSEIVDIDDVINKIVDYVQPWIN